MTKGELRSLIREILTEELSTGKYLTEAVNEAVNMDRILADKLCDNAEFESACMSGDACKILAIVDGEMEKNNLYTPGAKKLRNEIFAMTRGRDRIPSTIGEHIFTFAWYAKGSAAGVPTAVGKSTYRK